MFKSEYGMYHGAFDEYSEALVGPDCFDFKKTDRLYHHYYAEYTLVSQTDKAYLLMDTSENQFWCAKSLWKKVKIQNNQIKGYLWKRFSKTIVTKERSETPMFEKTKKLLKEWLHDAETGSAYNCDVDYKDALNELKHAEEQLKIKDEQ